MVQTGAISYGVIHALPYIIIVSGLLKSLTTMISAVPVLPDATESMRLLNLLRNVGGIVEKNIAYFTLIFLLKIKKVLRLPGNICTNLLYESNMSKL